MNKNTLYGIYDIATGDLVEEDSWGAGKESTETTKEPLIGRNKAALEQLIFERGMFGEWTVRPLA
jgi:hypothetical protein